MTSMFADFSAQEAGVALGAEHECVLAGGDGVQCQIQIARFTRLELADVELEFIAGRMLESWRHFGLQHHFARCAGAWIGDFDFQFRVFGNHHLLGRGQFQDDFRFRGDGAHRGGRSELHDSGAADFAFRDRHQLDGKFGFFTRFHVANFPQDFSARADGGLRRGGNELRALRHNVGDFHVLSGNLAVVAHDNLKCSRLVDLNFRGGDFFNRHAGILWSFQTFFARSAEAFEIERCGSGCLRRRPNGCFTKLICAGANPCVAAGELGRSSRKAGGELDAKELSKLAAGAV